jgi:hypothetical protein
MVMKLVGVGMATILILIGAAPVAYAQNETPVGRFAASSAGFEIQFSPNWSGRAVGESYAIVYPESGGPDAEMTVLVMDRLYTKRMMTSEIGVDSGRVVIYEDNTCGSLLNEFVMLNDVRVFHTVRECAGQDTYSKTGTYVIFTLTKSVAVSLSAASPEAYETHLPAFQSSLETMTISEPVDFRTALEVILGATNIFTHTLNVTSVDSVVRFTTATSSRVSEMAFNEEEKRISIAVSEQKRHEGNMIIPAHRLLVGPYQVQVDGEPSDNFLVIGDETGVTQLLIVQYERGEREIEIIGAQVVPEFGVWIPAVLAGTIGAAVLYRRWLALLMS